MDTRSSAFAEKIKIAWGTERQEIDKSGAHGVGFVDTDGVEIVLDLD